MAQRRTPEGERVKIPHFKTRVGFTCDCASLAHTVRVCESRDEHYNTKVRVVDAREPTPEQAVQKVLQRVIDHHPIVAQVNPAWYTNVAGMTATVLNGKVRVRKARKK